MNSNFISAKYEVTSAIIKRKEEKEMKKLTDLFHVEQKQRSFKGKQYGEPTATDIVCAIVALAGAGAFLFLLMSWPT